MRRRSAGTPAARPLPRPGAAAPGKVRAAVAVLIAACVAVSACGAGSPRRGGASPAASPSVSTAASTPGPLATTTAPALVTTPANCPVTSRHDDGFRAATASSGWELAWLDDAPEETSLRAGAATADGALWALFVRASGAIEPRRWHGGEWRAPPSAPSSQEVRALGAASADRAWVVVTADGALALTVWDGTAWRATPLVLGADTGAGPVAAGPWLALSTGSTRWDGAAWRSAPLPLHVNALTGSGDEPWAIGFADPMDPDASSALARWTGAAWQSVPVPALGLPPDAEPVHADQGRTVVKSVVRTGPQEWWALGAFQWMEHEHVDEEDIFPGRSVALRLAGGTWTCVVGSSWPDGWKGFTAAAPDGRGGLWAVSVPDELWHLSEGRWTRERPPVRGAGRASVEDLVARPGTGELYALGSIGTQPYGEDSRAALWRLRP